MAKNRKLNLRAIMKMAWDTRRLHPAKAFGDCLREAWAFAKRVARLTNLLFTPFNAFLPRTAPAGGL